MTDRLPTDSDDGHPDDGHPDDDRPDDGHPDDGPHDQPDMDLPLAEPSMSWIIAVELAVIAIIPVMDLPFPAAVPMLGIASLALWLSGTSWGDVGLRAGRLYAEVAIGFGLVFGTLTLVADVWLWGPTLQILTGEVVDLNYLPMARGNFAVLIYGIVLAWAGAFAAEMVFRGYLINRLETLFGTRGIGPWAALIVAAIAYGWALAVTQPAGLGVHWLGGAIMGVGYGLLYKAAQRTLVLPIAFHGAFETTNLILIYLKLI